MAKPRQAPKDKNTPGDVVAARAFHYSVTFFEFADKKYAELKTYPPDSPRMILMQAAIVTTTLIAMERRTDGGISDLHNGVSQAFPTVVRFRLLEAIQSLAVSLMQLNPAELKQTVIPSYAKLMDAPDDKIRKAVGLWLIHGITKKKVLDPADEAVAAAMARSAWDSGVMIARLLKR